MSIASTKMIPQKTGFSKPQLFSGISIARDPGGLEEKTSIKIMVLPWTIN